MRFVAAAFVCFSLSVIPVANAQSSSCGVALAVDVTSTVPLLPGEPLDLHLRVTNPANAPISLSRPSEETGTVRVLINSDPSVSSFRRYRGPMWGLLDLEEPPRTLAARSSYDRPLRVLYQSGRTAFALDAAGTYRFKATYQDSSACTPGIETATVNVNVVAPTGSDLVIWNAIKDCASCAFFLHTGVVRSTQADKDAVTLLRNLAKRYPKSRYSVAIRRQLDALDSKSTPEQ